MTRKNQTARSWLSCIDIKIVKINNLYLYTIKLSLCTPLIRTISMCQSILYSHRDTLYEALRIAVTRQKIVMLKTISSVLMEENWSLAAEKAYSDSLGTKGHGGSTGLEITELSLGGGGRRMTSSWPAWEASWELHLKVTAQSAGYSSQYSARLAHGTRGSIPSTTTVRGECTAGGSFLKGNNAPVALLTAPADRMTTTEHWQWAMTSTILSLGKLTGLPGL